MMKNTPENTLCPTLQIAIIDYYDCEKVILTDDGELMAFGRVPHSNTDGWFFVGYHEETASEFEQKVGRFS